MDSSLLTLPPYLLDKIKELVIRNVDLPDDLRPKLESTISAAESPSTDVIAFSKDEEGDTTNGDDLEVVPELVPPTIEIDLIERLARWAITKKAERNLRKTRLDPNEYTLISLLAGTQVYIPPNKLALLNAAHNPDKPNPYLPSHLSARASPLSGYKALNKQISTILNILFSIGGSGGAVYVASVTGAGYSREKGVILGLLGATIVGIAEVVLIWIFVWRVQEGRKREVENWKGSSGLGIKEIEAVLDETEQGEEVVMADKPKVSTVRLRRKGLDDKGDHGGVVVGIEE